jgi:hypothetical protein
LALAGGDGSKTLVEASDQNGRLLMPLYVGVIGIRGVKASPRLSKKIDQAIDLLFSAVPPFAEPYIQLIAVSTLQEGSDQLVAKEMLARINTGLEVILPFAQTDYEQDFAAAEARDTLRLLLQHARRVGTIRAESASQSATHDLPGTPSANFLEDGDDPLLRLSYSPDASYAAVGSTIVDRSDVLLAIWDGKADPPDDQVPLGGTFAAIQRARVQGRPLIWVRPEGGESPTLLTENLELTTAQEQTDEEWPWPWRDKSLRRLQQYNAADISEADLASQRSECAQDLPSTPSISPRLHYETFVQWLLPPLARSSYLARSWSRRTSLVEFGLYFLSWMAVSSVAYQLIWNKDHRWVALEVIALVLILVGLSAAHRLEMQDRWTAYEYLAERLRCSLVLALIGADIKIGTGPDPIGAEPAMARAFYSFWTCRPPSRATDEDVPALRQLLGEHWIPGLAAAEYRTADRSRRLVKHLHVAVGILFVVSLLVAIVHFSTEVKPAWLRDLLSWLSISVPASGAAVSGYLEQTGYRHEYERNRQLARGLERVGAQVLLASQLDDIRNAATKIDELIREANGERFAAARRQGFATPG